MDLPELSIFQYNLITNLMSFSVATMFAGALFFFFSRSQVAPKYRMALLITALVPAIACYHYVMIYGSFSGAYALVDGVYTPTGKPFNDAYRYADWLLTVPLLVIELVAVLALARDTTRSLATRLSIAAALMIALGYPGEVATETTTKMIWWTASMLPFLYILWVLFTEFSTHYKDQPAEVRGLVAGARAVILITWSFYPIAYLATVVGLPPATGETALQVGYTIADITAKVGMGVYIYFIAAAKTRADGWQPADAAGPVGAASPA